MMDTIFSDIDSFSESSSSDDFEDMYSSYGGQAHNIFSKLEETIEKIDDFLMFERSFVRGDIVSMVSDPLGPAGKVVGLSMTVDLEDLHGCKIRNVSSKDLQKIRSVSTGDYVIRGAWIGKVGKVVDCLTILFDNGTKRRLTLEGPEKIVSLSPDIVEDPNYPFYPGQRVQVESASSVSKSSGWLCGVGKSKKQLGTICYVDAELVCVEWLCCAVTKDGKRIAPPSLQGLKDLTILSCFADENWQLGDWCAAPLEKNSKIVNSSSGLVGEHRQREMVTRDIDLSSNIQQIAVIVKTKTKVDVQWQDGSKSLGLDSDMLFPVNIVDVHDFWPHTFVLEKGTDDLSISGSQRWGVVKTVDAKERTVKVKWSTSCDVEEEFVSAYELIEHPDYSFSVGETVFRAAEVVDLTEKNRERDDVLSSICVRKEDNLNSLASDENQIDYFDSKFVSCFGTVVGCEDGNIEVKWAGGSITKVAPYEIYIADKFEEASASFTNDVGNVQPPVLGSGENFKTQMIGKENLVAKNQPLGRNLKDAFDLDYYQMTETSSCSIAQAAVGFFTSVTSNLFAPFGVSLTGGYNCTEEDGEHPVQESLELCDSCNASSVDLNVPENIPSQETIEANENGNVNDLSTTSVPKSYRLFDMVSDCSDHHFANESGMDLLSAQAKRCWLKKVHREWSILEKDLPETIYVRVYEERIDLVRAAIVGPTGTPYHDGLFFFDIHLPPQYPNEPPMVYYHSGGLRINPNLYESGKVCLSLLNTWAGSQCEIWNPESSTILQVLVSIQGLVLNSKPYFNEAGYDSQIGKAEGEKNSISYNENAFLGNCRTMLYLLRKPPKHLEALVTEHFNRRGKDILLACNEYMQGAPIGRPYNMERELNVKGNSKGFKIMLGKLFPKLVEAFSETGLDCREFLDQFI